MSNLTARDIAELREYCEDAGDDLAIVSARTVLALLALARELADELPSATSAEARRLLERADVKALREEATNE